MLIVSQNKTVLLNVDHIVRIFNAGSEVLAVDLNKDTNLLGEYEDTTRAVAVLAEIAEEYAKYYRCSGGPSHKRLNGKRCPIDGKFENGCRYPCDPDCDDPAEVVNCHCFLTYE